MKLQKYEQSAFILETNGGYKVALDFAAMSPLLQAEAIAMEFGSVDACLVSHIHGDHFSLPHIQALYPEKVYLNAECIREIGEQEVTFEIVKVAAGDTVDIGEGVQVEYFAVDHGPNISAPVENLGFLIRADAETIYFAGDMFYPSGIDVSALKVDYALLPVGTHYTFGPIEAYNFAKTFGRIKTLVPMHYHNKPETYEQFVDLAGKEFSVHSLV